MLDYFKWLCDLIWDVFYVEYSRNSYLFFNYPLVRFKCIDLDGNGILTHIELQYFFEEQLHRMECMAQEPVLFEDILCQLVDMIGPEVCIPFLFLCSS